MIRSSYLNDLQELDLLSWNCENSVVQCKHIFALLCQHYPRFLLVVHYKHILPRLCQHYPCLLLVSKLYNLKCTMVTNVSHSASLASAVKTCKYNDTTMI